MPQHAAIQICTILLSPPVRYINRYNYIQLDIFLFCRSMQLQRCNPAIPTSWIYFCHATAYSYKSLRPFLINFLNASGDPSLLRSIMLSPPVGYINLITLYSWIYIFLSFHILQIQRLIILLSAPVGNISLLSPCPMVQRTNAYLLLSVTWVLVSLRSTNNPNAITPTNSKYILPFRYAISQVYNNYVLYHPTPLPLDIWCEFLNPLSPAVSQTPPKKGTLLRDSNI